MIPNDDWMYDGADFNYDPEVTSSSLENYRFVEPIKNDKLLKDIQECKSVNDFLRRIGDDIQWEDLR